MKKTKDLIRENLKLVDLVVEVIDARIPISSRNPIIHELLGDKDRIIALNKSDLSNKEANSKWITKLQKDGSKVLETNSMNGKGIQNVFNLLEKIQKTKDEERARIKPLRLMVVGIPNVGKSSFINRMTGRKSTQTGDRPGVTKGKQWLTLKNNMQLLDTPGILWPKFEDPNVGLNLAFCGSIKDEILDVSTLGLELVKVLQSKYPDKLVERYKIDEIDEDPLITMEKIAQKRGCILSGGRIDYERCARMILDEFRSGKIGNITLEE